MNMEEASLPPPPVVGLNRLNLGGGMALKPRAKPEKITDYKIEQFLHHRGKNATERLRELDKIRMYTPLPDEIQLLNVTPYRMNLLVMQDLMYLCGGLVGVRFSSEELQELLRLTKGMNSTWNDVSKAFQDMSTACKKLTLPTDESPSVAGVDQNGDDIELVKKLHASADEYVQLFAQLQVFVREKQRGVDPSARTDAPKLEADPESKMGRKLPEWLSVLIDKQQAAVATEAKETVPTVAKVPADAVKSEDSAPSVPAPAAAPFRASKLKVGELSVFLSGCMTGLVLCSVDEQEAIAVLVQASNDTVMSVSNSDIDSATGTSDHHDHNHSSSGYSSSGRSSPSLFAGGSTPRGRHYWARRFYNFLSKMTELASAIKDESALEKV